MRSGLTFLVAALVALALLLCGCSPKPDLAAVGTITLFQAVRDTFREHFGRVIVRIAGSTTRIEESMSSGTIVQERFPAWAKDTYAVCVHWQDPYEMPAVAGPMKRGTLHGWVLVGEDLSTHILEYSLVSEETGDRLVMLDQWQGLVDIPDAEGACEDG